MYRKRLRESYSDTDLKQIYACPNTLRSDFEYNVRIETTVALGNSLMSNQGAYTVADLSCGSGAIITGLANKVSTYLGDYAPGYDYQGPIEQTVTQLPLVGLFVCSETLEHLEDPELVLGQIRKTSKRLLLSTPISEQPDSAHPEHYWGWDQETVAAMLVSAGWAPVMHMDLFLPYSPFNFQIYGCE